MTSAVSYGMMTMEFSVGRPREELRGFARAIGDNGVGWAGLGLPEAASGE